MARLDRRSFPCRRGLSEKGLSSCNRAALYRYRAFYVTYPEIVRSLPGQLLRSLPAAEILLEKAGVEKVRSATAQSGSQQMPATSKIVATPSPQSVDGAKGLLAKLSYSHLEQLVRIDDADERRFYEQHCVQGMWSVRELNRQITSLYFERTDLSKDKATLHAKAEAAAEQDAPTIDIRDPYIFEFLGLRPVEVMGESVGLRGNCR